MPTKINVCTELSHSISDVTGIKSNSSSPSDTWIITFKKDIIFDNIPVDKGFLKIFIDMDNIPLKSKSKASLALKYEMNIYSSIINDIVKYNICPNFVKYLASGEQCGFFELFYILYPNLCDPDLKSITRKECLQKLNRNLYYVLTEKINRPSIQDDQPLNTDKPINFQKETYKYNVILTENIQNPFTFNEWLIKYGTNPKYNLELWNILFQITVACYTMSLCKLVHNDLHSRNIFIKDLEVDTYFLYNINDKQMIIKTRYQPLIYDFDRGYVERFGKNIYLESSLCTAVSQCNIFINNKDIVKILCYVYKNINKDTQNALLNIISNDKVYENKLKESYELKSGEGFKKCFLQYVDKYNNEKSIPVEWYDNFGDNMDILSSIYNKYLPKYLHEIIKKNNIFICNKDYFNPDGSIDIEKVITRKLFPVSLAPPYLPSFSVIYPDTKMSLLPEKKEVDNQLVLPISYSGKELTYSDFKFLQSEKKEVDNQLVLPISYSGKELTDSDFKFLDSGESYKKIDNFIMDFSAKRYF